MTKMPKFFCTLMLLFLTLSIFSLNKVESRGVYANSEVRHFPLPHYLRFNQGQINSESNSEDDQRLIHTKRKSELLSSLYGLPYALVNKRNAN